MDAKFYLVNYMETLGISEKVKIRMVRDDVMNDMKNLYHVRYYAEINFECIEELYTSMMKSKKEFYSGYDYAREIVELDLDIELITEHLNRNGRSVTKTDVYNDMAHRRVTEEYKLEMKCIEVLVTEGWLDWTE